MKAITGGALVKRLVTLRGKFFYANERSGDHRLHAALNAFEHEAMTLRGAEVAFASQNEADHAGALWDEVHALALRAFYRLGQCRRVFWARGGAAAPCTAAVRAFSLPHRPRLKGHPPMLPLLKRIPAEDMEPIRGRPRKLFMEDRAPVNPTEVRLTQIRESYLARLRGKHTPVVREIAERIAAKTIEAEVTAALWGADHAFTRRQDFELGRLIAALHLEHGEPLHPADEWPDEPDDDHTTTEAEH